MEPPEYSNEVLQIICRKFRSNPSINPITGNKMSLGSLEYNQIKNLCEIYEAKNMVMGHIDVGPYIVHKTFELKILESDYDTLLDIIKYDNAYDNYIYDNMNAIIKYNLGPGYFYTPPRTVQRNLLYNFDNSIIKERKNEILSEFIMELLKIDAFDLAREAIKSFKFLSGSNGIHQLTPLITVDIFETGSARMWYYYFGLSEDLEIDDGRGMLVLIADIQHSSSNLIDLIIPVFEEAINEGFDKVIDFMSDYWENERENFVTDDSEHPNQDNTEFIILMDDLVDEANK